MTLAHGTFANDEFDEQSDGDFEGTAFGRIHIVRSFTGSIEGTSTAGLLTARAADGSAAYVALDRFQGSVDGMRGAFVFQHWGQISAQNQSIDGLIVPGSGTGELAGIQGRGTIRVDADGAHHLELDYKLADHAGS